MVEILWEMRDGSVRIREFRRRRPSRFVFDMDGRLRLFTPSSMWGEEPVNPRK
jgi:hypothetical protein